MTTNTTTEAMVGMGQIAVGRAPQRMRAILGSCVGLVLYHPRLKTGVMAHIVLPDSAGRTGAPGKFADTAIPQMLGMLRELGVPTQSLSAKLAGGANMFGGSGPLQIGDANLRAVAAKLGAAGIRIAAQDVGGTSGRRVTFDCTSGIMTVENAARSSLTL